MLGGIDFDSGIGFVSSYFKLVLCLMGQEDFINPRKVTASLLLVLPVRIRSASRGNG